MLIHAIWDFSTCSGKLKDLIIVELSLSFEVIWQEMVYPYKVPQKTIFMAECYIGIENSNETYPQDKNCTMTMHFCMLLAMLQLVTSFSFLNLKKFTRPPV